MEQKGMNWLPDWNNLKAENKLFSDDNKGQQKRIILRAKKQEMNALRALRARRTRLGHSAEAGTGEQGTILGDRIGWDLGANTWATNEDTTSCVLEGVCRPV